MAHEITALAGLAYGLGSGVVWAATGQYAVLQGVAVAAAGLGALWLVVRRTGTPWAWAVAPLYVVVAWVAGGGSWSPSPVVAALALAGALAPRAPIALRADAGRFGRWVGTGSLLVAYGVLAMGVIAGIVPWVCTGAYLAVVPGWRMVAVLSDGSQRARSQVLAAEWSVAFTVLVAVGYLVQGLVR